MLRYQPKRCFIVLLWSQWAFSSSLYLQQLPQKEAEIGEYLFHLREISDPQYFSEMNLTAHKVKLQTLSTFLWPILSQLMPLGNLLLSLTQRLEPRPFACRNVLLQYHYQLISFIQRGFVVVLNVSSNDLRNWLTLIKIINIENKFRHGVLGFWGFGV